MALLSPAFIAGLANTGFGEQFAQQTALANQQLQANALKLQQAQAQQQASNLWAKAISDVLAGSGQAPGITPPVAPQPGQPAVAGTQPGGTPLMDVPAGARPQTQADAAAGAAPAQKTALTTPKAPPSAQDAISQLLGGTTTTPQLQPPQPSPYQQLQPYSILKQIEQDNPDLAPGVLASIVDDHLMPMMSDQQKAQVEQYKMAFDFTKLLDDQKDKVISLALKSADIANRFQLGQDSLELRKEMVGLRADSLALAQSLAADRHDEIQARIEEIKAQTAKLQSEQNKKGPAAKLPPVLQARLTALEKKQSALTSQIDNASMAGDTQRQSVLQGQLDETNTQINELLDQADQLQAQGAPTQNPPSNKSGDTNTAGVPQQPIPKDTPVPGIPPEVWATMTNAQKQIYRDLYDGKIDKETATKELNKLTAP